MAVCEAWISMVGTAAATAGATRLWWFASEHTSIGCSVVALLQQHALFLHAVIVDVLTLCAYCCRGPRCQPSTLPIVLVCTSCSADAALLKFKPGLAASQGFAAR